MASWLVQFTGKDFVKPFTCMAFPPWIMPTPVEKDTPEIPNDTGQGNPDAICRVRIVVTVDCNNRAGDLPAICEKFTGRTEAFHVAPRLFKRSISVPYIFGSVREWVK